MYIKKFIEYKNSLKEIRNKDGLKECIVTAFLDLSLVFVKLICIVMLCGGAIFIMEDLNRQELIYESSNIKVYQSEIESCAIINDKQYNCYNLDRYEFENSITPNKFIIIDSNTECIYLLKDDIIYFTDNKNIIENAKNNTEILITKDLL